MSADPVRGAVNRLPPLPELVHPTAKSSDPGQTLHVDGKGRLHLRGVAAGAAGSGSEIALTFDGFSVSVAPRPGTAPLQTLHLLERVMPSGYRLNLAATLGDELVLEIVRRPCVRAVLSAREEPMVQTARAALGDLLAS